MTLRLTDDQRTILAGLRSGRRIVPVERRTPKPGPMRVVLGFSDREPVNAGSLAGLVTRGIVAIRDGEITLTEAGRR